jgi:hypothetical protein
MSTPINERIGRPIAERLIPCPFCNEPDYDFRGLKRHLLAGECDAFNDVEQIVNPFDLLRRRANPPDPETASEQLAWSCERRGR